MSARDHFKLAGLTVAEKYVVQAAVGESSYAVVYRAVHARSSDAVALQVFKVLGDYDSDARHRLLRAFSDQGTRLGALGPQAAAIRAPRDIGPLTTRDGKWVPFMAFDWLEGTSLDAILKAERGARAGPHTLGAAMKFLEPVAAALDVLHAHGLAHLDVKPGNVFLVEPGAIHPQPSVRLLDCGTAHLVSHALDGQRDAASLSIAPTYFEPAYAAPEQFVSPGPPKGPWTDVFALALLLVEMITGKPPANEANVGALATAPRPTPRMLGAHVSDAVEAVFARALSLDPRQRYATAGEFWSAAREALERYPAPALSAVTAASSPPGRMRAQVQTSPDLAREKLEAAELAQRSPRLVIVSLTLLLVGIAVGLLFWHR